jgi:hypothetical protein
MGITEKVKRLIIPSERKPSCRRILADTEKDTNPIIAPTIHPDTIIINGP